VTADSEHVELLRRGALNSSMLNGARVLGPAVAGVIIGIAGLASCFLINGLSFLAIIVAYLLMRLPPHTVRKGNQTLKQATFEAVRYVVGERFLRSVLVLVMTVSLFGWPYAVLMPVIARDTLGLQASGYSYLMALNGIGAFLGAVMLATLGDYEKKPRLLFGGVIGFSLTLIVFALSRNVVLAAIALVLAGWFMIIFFATANSVVQLGVPDALRGRVMGIYSFCFIGLSPIGSLVAGILAKLFSAPFTILLGAILCLGVAMIALVRARNFKAVLPGVEKETWNF
jgi:MFS family permease